MLGVIMKHPLYRLDIDKWVNNHLRGPKISASDFQVVFSMENKKTTSNHSCI
ncbi:unnamed protein product, partial [Musa hybrid cultivar]